MPSEATVLVIDDEPAIERVLDAALRARYDVHAAGTGGHGIELATALQPDVLIVDLGLPDIDGVEVCRRLRTWTANPIIVLTVDDGENRKVEALDAGADDYITKPFSVPELLARVRVALRHRQAIGQVVDPDRIEVGALRIDIAAHEVRVDDGMIRLTPQELRSARCSRATWARFSPIAPCSSASGAGPRRSASASFASTSTSCARSWPNTRARACRS